jgi:hypothetical protein
MYPTALDLAGRSLPMIAIHVEKHYGSSTIPLDTPSASPTLRSRESNH